MRLLIVSICLVVASLTASAQNVVVKTNLLYDITATANLGIEFKVAPKWTVDISGNLNAWTFSDNKKWKHWVLQPEARYWLCDRFMGHFLAVHAHGGPFNIGNLKNDISFLGTYFSKLSDNRFQAWFGGAGIAYGYALPLGKHWNAEFEIGIGYAYSHYDRFECEGCGQKVEEGKHHNYFGPTKAAISLVYLF